MHISAPFIKRPVGTMLLTLAVLFAGGVAYYFLPVAALPDVDFPTIQVSAGLPGASPETMASAVATPLERQFGRIAGVTEMTSVSLLGATNITLQFDLNRSIDPARLSQLGVSLEEVRAALGRVNANKPKGELSDGSNSWTITATDQLFDADQYRPVIVAYKNGAPIRLGDVATVESSVADVRTGGIANGKRAVLLILYRQPGANIIETV